MSDTYRNSTRYVYLDIYGGMVDTSPTAVAVTPDGTVTELTVNGDTPVEGAEQRFVIVLGLAQTQYAGEVKVIWNFTMGGVPVTKTDYFDVVVPLVEVDDIRAELNIPPDFSDDDLILAERRVRLIVERYCGQTFAPTHETLTVKSNGDSLLRTPKRLVSITGIKNYRSGLSVTGGEIRNDGWAILRSFRYDDDVPLTVTGPIFDPYVAQAYRWSTNTEWEVEGVWGWERVPTEVKEATLILIEQVLCPESTYRDRYLTSMKASDWRFDISPAAFAGTGNVIADQLLAPYKVVQAAVI